MGGAVGQQRGGEDGLDHRGSGALGAPSWDSARLGASGARRVSVPGAYLAPCSGWNGNTYSVDIRAMKGNTVLGEIRLKLGFSRSS